MYLSARVLLQSFKCSQVHKVDGNDDDDDESNKDAILREKMFLFIVPLISFYTAIV